MAYVNVAEWKPEQVTEWLKGLDNTVFQYVHSFLNNEVNGQQLLNLRPDDLDHLGVQKLGHQELILEAVEHLRNFHYELDRENLQLLGLQLACRALSLHNELKQRSDSQLLSTQTLADVAHVIMAVKPLVCWLDRSPFSGQSSYQERKDELLHLSLQIATCAQRDRFAEKPVEEIRSSCKKLAKLGDEIIQEIVDPLILQPASLDLVTLKKRASDDLGFFILPSFHGVHQIAEINFSSPAHQCGKIENGDEIVQVNYQTVVGWQTKKVMALFEESPTEVFLTLKKRPRHTKVYGQIYMKPYRLPSKKRSAPYSRWNDNLPSPRPELLTIPDFEIPLSKSISKKVLPHLHSHFECSSASSTLTTEVKKEEDLEVKSGGKCVEDDEEDDDDDDSFLPEAADEGQASPTSMRLYLPKPRVTVQRRATVTGASPTSKRPPVNVEQFWAELRLERHWRDCGAPDNADRGNCDLYQLRDKSASVGNGLSFHLSRPCTTIGIGTNVSKIKSSQQHKAFTSGNKIFKKATEAVQSKAVQTCSVYEKCAAISCDKNCNVSVEKPERTSSVKKNFLKEDGEMLCHVENNTNPLLSHDCPKETCIGQVCEGLDFSAINFPVIYQYSSERENNSEILLKESDLETKELSNMENEGTVNMLQSSCIDNSESVHESASNETSYNQWTQISSKERGRLDKSYSTPAYDLLESITFLEKNVRKFGNVHDETTEVNFCTIQTHLEHDKFPCELNIPIPQPTLSSVDSHSDDFKKCEIDLVGMNEIASCMNTISEKNSTLLLSEKISNGCASILLQNVPLKNQLSCNKTLNLPVKSVEKKIENISFCSQMDADVSSGVKTEDILGLSESVILSGVSDKSSSPVKKDLVLQSSKNSEKSLKCVNSMCKVRNYSQTCQKMGATECLEKTIPTQTVETGLGKRRASPNAATIGVPATSFSSPLSTRKRNALLSKRRKVSVKDVGSGECEGWLLHRFRSSGAGATWMKVWFILKGIIFYGFKTPEASKAHIMIVLPGFTVCVAEEVKSRSFSFKIYHTGTVFYFAAETADELGVWLGYLSVAAISQNLVKPPSGFNFQNVYFSETDEDSDCQKDTDSETNIPKNNFCKCDGFCGSNNQQNCKVYQKSRNESKKTDSPKLFGSLKKMVSKTENNGPTDSPEPASSSLDRKYLNFLGAIRSSNVPVPTAQFRSYRRAPKKSPVNEVGGVKSDPVSGNVRLIDKLPVSKVADTENTPPSNLNCSLLYNETSSVIPQDFPATVNTRCSSESGGVPNSFATKHNLDLPETLENGENNMFQSHKPLKIHNIRDRQLHASNPTLQLSSDMLNYRLAAERLRKFGLSRNQQEDTSGFVTLEKLMSSQEDEKCKQQQSNFTPVSSSGLTSKPPNNYLDTTHAQFINNSGLIINDLEVSSSTGVLSETKIHNENPAIPMSKNENCIDAQPNRETVQDSRVLSSNKHPRCILAHSELASQEVVSTLDRNATISCRCTNLKPAAQYQPPPISQVLTSGRKVHPKEDCPKMKLAFEMHLGANKLLTAPNKDSLSKSSKLRNLFLFTKNQNVKNSHSGASFSSPGETRKPLIGSPRLARTFLWEKQAQSLKMSGNKINNVDSSLPPPSSVAPAEWPTDFSSPQSDNSISQVKPMMGVAMISKKPCRVVMGPSSPPQSSSTPDYPGLEYPPVFEPETYTLSDASTLLKSRHHHSCSSNKLCTCNIFGNAKTKN